MKKGYNYLNVFVKVKVLQFYFFASRVKQAMLRLKNLEDKANWSGIDKAAAKRFVKSGLWQPKEKEEEGGKNPKRQRRN